MARSGRGSYGGVANERGGITGVQIFSPIPLWDKRRHWFLKGNERSSVGKGHGTGRLRIVKYGRWKQILTRLVQRISYVHAETSGRPFHIFVSLIKKNFPPHRINENSTRTLITIDCVTPGGKYARHSRARDFYSNNKMVTVEIVALRRERTLADRLLWQHGLKKG